MSKKSDYTEEEWFILSSLPPMIGAVVSGIDSSGVVGTFKEMQASMQTAVSALRDHESNELIQQIVRGEATNMRDAMAASQANQKRLLERAKAEGVKGPEDFAELAVKDCAVVADLLDAKSTPEEAADFKQWATSIGQVVAEAAKEGSMFGFGSGEVSDKEEALLKRIQDALRVG